jgi:predicted amidophosphoribosyltransferase
MAKNQTPVSDAFYEDQARCAQCGAAVSSCDERCPECYAPFRDDPKDEAAGA